MSISIYLHKVYQQYCDNKEVINIDGKTLKECIYNMIALYPDLGNAIFIEKDKLHPLVKVYLNSSDIYPDPMGKKVFDGDKIYLIHAMAGG